jgi:hypothetical protein
MINRLFLWQFWVFGRLWITMENRGKRATKNHRKYAFHVVFVQFLARCNGEFIRAQGAALMAGMFRQLSFH